jgi:hypothetical protein
MLSARVCDPLGPFWTRATAPAVAVGLGVLLAIATFFGWPFLPTAAPFFVAAVLFAAWNERRRRPVRTATVDLGRTYIVLKGAGPLSQRIAARDVVAARMASAPHGASLVLVRRHGRRRPLVLELGTEEDLRLVRTALRIGPRGFGVISWPALRRGNLGASFASVEVAWFMLLAVGLVSAEWIGPLGAPFVAGPLAWALLMALEAVGPAGGAPGVVLSEASLVVSDGAGRTTRATYADVSDVGVRAPDGALVLRTGRGSVVVPAPEWLDEERRCVVAQIASAAERARNGTPKAHAVPSALAFLEPRREDRRQWLERVDSTASALASPDAYRRPHVPLTDLWTALECPEAPPEVRGAAARILARIAPAEATKRVADVLASERDARAREVIHLALEEDIDGAAAALDELARS